MLLRASELEPQIPVDSDTAFALSGLSGRLAVVGGLGAPTYAASLLYEAQATAQRAVWISAHPAPVYPPDLARCGVDCELLPFVQLSDAGAAFEAAEICLRSQAFGLIIIDTAPEHTGVRCRGDARTGHEIPRLARLAEHNSVALLVLCDNATSYAPGPLVSLRISANRRLGADGKFVLELQLLKDKRGAGRLRNSRTLYGPDAMC